MKAKDIIKNGLIKEMKKPHSTISRICWASLLLSMDIKFLIFPRISVS